MTIDTRPWIHGGGGGDGSGVCVCVCVCFKSMLALQMFKKKINFFFKTVCEIIISYTYIFKCHFFPLLYTFSLPRIPGIWIKIMHSSLVEIYIQKGKNI